MSEAEQSADIYSRAVAYVVHGISSYGKRFMEDAVINLLKGIDLSEGEAVDFWNLLAQFYLAEVYLEMSEYQKSGNHYDNAIGIYEQNAYGSSFRNLGGMGSSLARVMSNAEDINLESLEALVSENKLRFIDGSIRRYLGEILLNIDDQHTSEAQHWIEQAIEADERNGMRFHLGRDYALYAELFKRKGDIEKAKETLGKAIEIYKECGSDGWVTKAEEELAKLS